MTAWLPEGKVTAASIGAALGGLVVWVLYTYAFLVVGGVDEMSGMRGGDC